MEFEEIWNRNWKEWKDLNAKMRKEFDNAKAKHDLNKKNGIRAIGLSFLTHFLETKNVKEREEGEKKKKRKKKRREEKRRKQKVWNYEFLYEFPYNCMVSSLPQT